MFLLPSPLSVLKLPIIRECECECEGRGKKGSLLLPPPPEFVEKVGTRANKGNEGRRGERFPLSPSPYPRPFFIFSWLLLQRSRNIMKKNSIKTCWLRRSLAKLLLRSSKTFQRPKLVFRHGILSKKTLQSVTSLRLENRPPRKRRQNVQDGSKPVLRFSLGLSVAY